MVKLIALKDCRISFKRDNVKKIFNFKKNEVIEEEDNFIIDKLINTKLIIIHK